MDVLAVVLLVFVGLASVPVGGPFLILAGLIAFDIPSGFQDAAADFLSGGGWVIPAVGGLVAFGAGLYAFKAQDRRDAGGNG